ncbi:MAG: hypothetical protein IIC50_13595 [Planctomycetes bacterium]|nr:hypothetical protein [Planctomycetota bacterium]
MHQIPHFNGRLFEDDDVPDKITTQEILTLARFGTEAGVAMFSADGACLATSTQGGGVQLWRAPLFQEIAATEAQEKAEIKQP